ncbi:hypothetical protein OHS81_10620 [Streptomyces sp. NBC_00400]|uniref:hypothetical protein n=1 Tax=Streptomyces sp. NBC_00400 TaxID=2975737 RepID=UPI002E1B4E32
MVSYEPRATTGRPRRSPGCRLCVLPARVRFTGQDGPLTELLTSAATTRRQACVRPVGKVVPLSRQQLRAVLQELHGA